MDSSVRTGTGSRGLQGFYTRQTTGLVRELGTGGAVLMSLAVMSPPYLLFIVTLAPFAAPGSNWLVYTILAAVMCCFIALLWGWLTQLMPRTGGDYIFVSRTIHPAVGFVASVVLNLFIVFSVSSVFATLSPQYLAAAFAAVGIRTGNSGALHWATVLSGQVPTYFIAVGAILIALVIASLPIRTFVKVFAICFPIGAISILMAVIILATHNSADLGSVLKSFHSSYGRILGAASKAGYHPSGGFNIAPTFAATAIVFGFLGFGITSAYMGSEVRRPSTTVTRAYLRAIGIGAVVLLTLLFVAAHALGENWIGAATYLGNIDPKQYPFPSPPGIMLFASLLVSNPLVIAVMNGLLVLLVIVTQGPAFFLTTRSMLAWSFDRVVPEKFAEVNERTHTPLFATGVLFVVYLVIVGVMVFGPSSILSLAFGALLGQLPIFMLVAIAAIIIPWRRPALYHLAPIAQRKIAGVPAITVVGVIALGVYAYFFQQYLTNDALGANSVVVFISFPVMVVIAAVGYGVSKLINRRRGIELDLAFKELPPE